MKIATWQLEKLEIRYECLKFPLACDSTSTWRLHAFVSMVVRGHQRRRNVTIRGSKCGQMLGLWLDEAPLGVKHRLACAHFLLFPAHHNYMKIMGNSIICSERKEIIISCLINFFKELNNVGNLLLHSCCSNIHLIFPSTKGASSFTSPDGARG